MEHGFGASVFALCGQYYTEAGERIGVFVAFEKFSCAADQWFGIGQAELLVGGGAAAEKVEPGLAVNRQSGEQQDKNHGSMLAARVPQWWEFVLENCP